MKAIWDNVNSEIPYILENYHRIAVVGLSPKVHRPSHSVARYLQAAGYHIIPVNPTYDTVLDLKSYPNLSAIPESIEIVDIFRRSDQVLPVVEEAIAIGAKVVWMQSGVINEEAAGLALDAGLKVVMDACIKIEHAMRNR